MKKIVSLALVSAISICMFAGCTKSPGETSRADSNLSDSESSVESRLEESPVEDFEYTIDGDEVTITRYAGKSPDVVVPARIDGKEVTAIGSHSFGYSYAQNVVMQKPIKRIEERAFWYAEFLKKVQFSESLEYIGESAFAGCAELESISDFPKSLKFIGAGAFSSDTKLTKVSLPVDCELGTGIFSNTGLTTIDIPDGIKIIPNYMFAETHITEVTIPGSVETIRAQAFLACLTLEKIVLQDGIKTIEIDAFASTAVSEVIIPKTVESMSEYAFVYCDKLNYIKFEGDAPDDFAEDELGKILMKNYHGDFTVFYHEGASGFTSPEWNGYKTATW